MLFYSPRPGFKILKAGGFICPISPGAQGSGDFSKARDLRSHDRIYQSQRILGHFWILDIRVLRNILSFPKSLNWRCGIGILKISFHMWPADGDQVISKNAHSDSSNDMWILWNCHFERWIISFRYRSSIFLTHCSLFFSFLPFSSCEY